MFGSLLKYLRLRVFTYMSTFARLRKGFSSMFSYFAQCLWDSMEPLRALKVFEAVISENKGSSMTEHYLKCGRTVEVGDSALFKRVMDDSLSVGDGAIWDYSADELKVLLACRNDDEFGFVSSMCGNARVRQGQCFSAIERSLDENDL